MDKRNVCIYYRYTKPIFTRLVLWILSMWFSFIFPFINLRQIFSLQKKVTNIYTMETFEIFFYLFFTLSLLSFGSYFILQHLDYIRDYKWLIKLGIIFGILTLLYFL